MSRNQQRRAAKRDLKKIDERRAIEQQFARSEQRPDGLTLGGLEPSELANLGSYTFRSPKERDRFLRSVRVELPTKP